MSAYDEDDDPPEPVQRVPLCRRCQHQVLPFDLVPAPLLDGERCRDCGRTSVED